MHICTSVCIILTCIWSLLIGVEPRTFHVYELNRWAEEYLGMSLTLLPLRAFLKRSREFLTLPTLLTSV